MISVVIPTYNRHTFLAEAIQSVLLQTTPIDEIIIVDDGSTDGTDQLIQQLASTSSIPLRYHYQDNQGAAAARNRGVAEARGELICFLDSDDLLVPEKIQLQKQVLDESGCLVSHTGERWLRRGKHLNQKLKHQPPDGYIFPECLPMCVVGMSTVMVRREIFDIYGLFNESLPCCEDYDFWLRVSTGEKFKLVPKPLTVKNGGRDDQLSVIHRVGMDRFRIRSLVNLLENISLTHEQFSMALRELKCKCDIYGNGCIKHGRTDEGHGYLQLPAKYMRECSAPNPAKIDV